MWCCSVPLATPPRSLLGQGLLAPVLLCLLPTCCGLSAHNRIPCVRDLDGTPEAWGAPGCLLCPSPGSVPQHQLCQMQRQLGTVLSPALISPSFFPCPTHSWSQPSRSLGIMLFIHKSSREARGPILDSQEQANPLGAVRPRVPLLRVSPGPLHCAAGVRVTWRHLRSHQALPPRLLSHEWTLLLFPTPPSSQTPRAQALRDADAHRAVPSAGGAVRRGGPSSPHRPCRTAGGPSAAAWGRPGPRWAGGGSPAGSPCKGREMSAPRISRRQRPGFRAGLCPASFAPRWQEYIREIREPGVANPKPSELFQPARSSASLQILLQRGQQAIKGK